MKSWTWKVFYALVATFIAIAVFPPPRNSQAAANVATFVPLQMSQSGLWFDPINSGEGFSVDVADAPNGVHAQVTFYAGAETGNDLPFWLVADVPMHGVTTNEQPLYKSTKMFGSHNPAEPLEEVGSITLTSVDCERLTADVTLTGPGFSPITPHHVHYDLSPLTLPVRDQCNACPVHMPSPADPRCLE